MGPKIRALVEFLEAGGKRGCITNPPPNVTPALARTGTLVVPDCAET